jgi:hypothetical protein
MNVPIRTDAKGVFTRAEIEGAMDAFDRHDETGENSDIFSRLRACDYTQVIRRVLGRT